MNNREELSFESLDGIVGGSINYAPDALGSSSGRIGIDGNYTRRYNSESDVINYVKAHINDKNWSSPSERDQYLFNGMISAGIIF